MEHPYCTVDGVDYQLYFDENGTLRFPRTKEDCSDLNRLIIDYYNGKVDLQTVWEEYTQTNSSYYLVEGIFSPYGMNNHTVTQGNGKCKEMVLHSGDPEIDASYNMDDNDKIIHDISNAGYKLHEEVFDMEPTEIVSMLEELLNKAKKLEV